MDTKNGIFSINVLNLNWGQLSLYREGVIEEISRNRIQVAPTGTLLRKLAFRQVAFTACVSAWGRLPFPASVALLFSPVVSSRGLPASFPYQHQTTNYSYYNVVLGK